MAGTGSRHHSARWPLALLLPAVFAFLPGEAYAQVAAADVAFVPLNADFRVEKLVSVDPLTGQETWEPTGMSPDDPIEYGLKVRLNGLDWSSGAAYYEWYKNSGWYGWGPILEKTYCGPTQFQLKLTVYDAAWQNFDSVTYTVYVGGPMQLRSTMALSAATFDPGRFALRGAELWVVSAWGDIGVADISDPYNLPALEEMPAALPQCPLAMAISDNPSSQPKLYFARGTPGVDVYRAERANFGFLSNLSVPELGGNPCWLAAAGDLLYIGIDQPWKLLTYDFTDPLHPVRLNALVLPHVIADMGQVGHDALVLHNGGALLSVVDIRVPHSPVLSTTRNFAVDFAGSIQSAGYLVAAAASSGTLLFELVVPSDPGDGLGIGAYRVVQPTSCVLALTPARLYVRSGGANVSKYDITNWNEPSYLMEQFSTLAVGAFPIFLFDADGPGAQYGDDAFLFSGTYAYGFCSFSAQDPP